MRSIFVYLTASLGDFIMSSAALVKLRQHFADHKIVLVTMQSSHAGHRDRIATYTDHAASVPWVDMVVPHLIDEYYVLDSISLKNLLALRNKLKSKGYSFDAAIMMFYPNAPWQARLKKMALANFLVGSVPIYGWREQGFLLSQRQALQAQGLLRHHVLSPFQFMKELLPSQPLQEDEVKFDLHPDPAALVWAEEWINANLPLGTRAIGIAPGSIQPHKKWPEEKFATLIDMLLARYDDIKFVVFGTGGDKQLGDRLAAINPSRIINLCGQTSIAKSAALFSYFTLVIGNDGGAMHLADAMGCKALAIVPGLEYPNSIEPWHSRELAVRYPVPCSPCYSFTECPQGHNRCMVDLPIADVLAKAVIVLGGI